MLDAERNNVAAAGRSGTADYNSDFQGLHAFRPHFSGNDDSCEPVQPLCTIALARTASTRFGPADSSLHFFFISELAMTRFRFFLSMVLMLCAAAASAQDSAKKSASTVKPLKVLLVTGGCCHDYKHQKDIL